MPCSDRIHQTCSSDMFRKGGEPCLIQVSYNPNPTPFTIRSVDAQGQTRPAMHKIYWVGTLEKGKWLPSELLRGIWEVGYLHKLTIFNCRRHLKQTRRRRHGRRQSNAPRHPTLLTPSYFRPAYALRHSWHTIDRLLNPRLPSL